MDISRTGNSVSYRFSDESADIAARLYATTDAEWNSGATTGYAAARGNALINLINPTTDIAGGGTWTGSLSIDTFPGYVEDSRITWEAEGDITVETSVNGTTWTAATNGSAPIPRTNLQYAELDVFVRITFGTTDARVEKINLTLYSSKYLYGTNSDIVATVTGKMLLAEKSYALGTFLNTLSIDGNISVPVDTEEDSTVGFESIVKFPTNPVSATIFSTTGASITTNASGAWVATGLTLYVDGVLRSTPYTPAPGEYHHVVASFANTTTPLVFSGTQTLAYLGTFNVAPTASDANLYYGEWFGIAPVRFTEVSEGNITEDPVSVKAYSLVWSVSS